MAVYTEDFAAITEWENGPGDWASCSISGGVLNFPSAADAGMRYNNTFANDQYSQVVYTTSGDVYLYPGVAVRMTTADEECYAAFFRRPTENQDVQIVEVTEGLGNTLLTSASVTVGSTNTIRIEVEGTAIRAYIGGALAASTSDATLTSGAAGVVGYESIGTLTMDNWEGGDIAGATKAPPIRRPALRFVRRILNLLSPLGY